MRMSLTCDRMLKCLMLLTSNAEHIFFSESVKPRRVIDIWAHGEIRKRKGKKKRADISTSCLSHFQVESMKAYFC